MALNDRANEKATLMIREFQRAIDSGCRHYDPETDELLPDVKSILACLRRVRSVRVEPPVSP